MESEDEKDKGSFFVSSICSAQVKSYLPLLQQDNSE